jgi:hypothetical protein
MINNDVYNTIFFLSVVIRSTTKNRGALKFHAIVAAVVVTM